MPSPLPLTVSIIARNEAHNLPRCLASVRGWVTDVVIVINNCTDDTAGVARAHGAVVLETEWRGYRDTKNWALDRCTQPWALCLDADEEVSLALRAEIAAFFARGDDQRFRAARFPRKVWFIDRWITHGDWYPDHNTRLVHRAHCRWGGDRFVHERMEVDGAVATLRGDLHHYSFPTLASHVAKINPFADLFVQQQQARGGRFSIGAALFRPAWRFFRAYVLRLGFLDGFPGLYIAWATAFGAFVRYSRLYEQEHRADPR